MKESKKLSIVFGITCFALVFGITLQTRTVNQTNSEMSQNHKLNNLRADVLKSKEKYEKEFKKLEEAELTLEKQRESSISENSELAKKEEEIKNDNEIIGMTDVTGPGVIIQLSDSDTDIRTALDTSALIVHDIDILSVINELKNAGAEAISINDQRIVNSTGIVCGGNIININEQKVGAPFEIKAIGLPEQLAAVDRPGSYIELLKQDGIEVDFKKVNQLTIPKYEGIIPIDNLTNIEKK